MAQKKLTPAQQKKAETIRIEALHMACRNRPTDYYTPAVAGVLGNRKPLLYDMIGEAKKYEEYILTGEVKS